MKRISKFQTSWETIDKFIHELKGALVVNNEAIRQQELSIKAQTETAKQLQRSNKKLARGIEDLYDSINDMKNGGLEQKGA